MSYVLKHKNHIQRIKNSTSYYPNVPGKPKKLTFFPEPNLTRHFTWACWEVCIHTYSLSWLLKVKSHLNGI